MSSTVGKFQMVNQTTDAGKDVTVITGVVEGHLLSNDYKNHVLCQLLIERMFTVIGDESMSPEDFLEGLDSIDWRAVLNS